MKWAGSSAKGRFVLQAGFYFFFKLFHFKYQYAPFSARINHYGIVAPELCNSA